MNERDDGQDERKSGKLIPFPIRFAEPVEKQRAPRRKASEVYDDSTTVENSGQYEDPTSDPY